MPLIIFDSATGGLAQNSVDSGALPPRPRKLAPGPLRPSGGQQLSFDSGETPPLPGSPLGALDSEAGAPAPPVPGPGEGFEVINEFLAGSSTDSESGPPAPPIRAPGDALIVANEFLQGPQVEGPLVPPAVPAPGPGALTGGPDGDQSVANLALTPGGKGYTFFIQSPENPGEVPVLPPPAPPFGPVDP